MVKINKKKTDTPPSLLTAGAAEIAALKKMTQAQLVTYAYKSSLYGSPEVKNKLKELQKDKCCFCEARISHVSHGDVEHFRPKAGWMQQEKDKLAKPGYYWLAYDFSNLFLSCQICNQKYKKNYFPLADPSKRAKTHKEKLSGEKALIIDPGKDNPSKFLSFNKEFAVPVNNNPKGIETIKRTGLNRKEILKDRSEYLEILQQLANIARNNLPDAASAKAYFKKIAKPDRIYSLMVRTNFPDLV
ncbi:MAG: hypothetical protein EON98_07300 [Chitinophagaceae bacterium]|nr:MAG: hypothetical protein EON98_07300 [Chitinophagaceae bacterium]